MPNDESSCHTLAASGALLVQILAAARMEMCILHGYQTFPNMISSDVDVMASPLGLRIALTTNFAGWKLVQCMRHQYSCYYLVYATTQAVKPKFLVLDVALDYRRDGRIFYDHREVLRRATYSQANLPIAPVDIEFGYYIVKKICKSSINEQQGNRLSELWHQDSSGCRSQLAKFFPDEIVTLVAKAAETGQWRELDNNVGRIRRAMLRKMLITRPWSTFSYYCLEVGRIAGRTLKPTGIVVSFLGPDGSGKSTLIERMDQWLGAAFRHTANYHLRPHWGHRIARKAETNPHGKADRPLFMSIAKLAYWVADGSLGYFLAIWPLKVGSTLVLFDRYFHDIFVDKRRYRYGGPTWIARIASHFIVKPDLFLILNAPAEIVQSRKPEVSPEESERQQSAYLDLARSLPNAHVLDASKHLEQVAFDATGVILSYLAERTARRITHLAID